MTESLTTEEYIQLVVAGVWLVVGVVAWSYSLYYFLSTRKKNARKKQEAFADICVAKLEASFGDRFDHLETRIDRLENLFVERMGDLFRDHKTDMDRHFGKVNQSLVRLESGRLVEIDLKLDRLTHS